MWERTLCATGASSASFQRFVAHRARSCRALSSLTPWRVAPTMRWLSQQPHIIRVTTIRKETGMTLHAKGNFDVKVTPQAPDGTADAGVGRMVIAKQFHGELQGAGSGQMLAMGTAVDGSAGYVAMERVTGSVHGRHGSFALQHSGTMDRGQPTLTITIVPDSGTDALAGIAGELVITIANGVHAYDLAYSLPDAT